MSAQEASELPVKISQTRRRWRFDRFEIDPVERTLTADGQPVAVTPKAIAALLVLAESPGAVVRKETLMERLWPDTVVTEANLTQTIFSLRKALAVHAGDARLVVTVPGQGYTLAAELTPTAEEAPVRSMPRSRRLWAVGGVLSLAAVACIAWILRPSGSAPSVATTPRTVVAVATFGNLSGRPEDAWLATALAEMLTTEIGAGSRLRVVSREAVASAGDLAALDAGALERARTGLGAHRVVGGGYVRVGAGDAARLRVDLRVADAGSGEVRASLSEEGEEQDLFGIVARLGARLRRELGADDVSDAQALEARASRPSSPEAVRLYAEGLAALRRFDALGARQILEKAAASDPKSAAIRSALSRAWTTLGYDAKAATEADAAVALAAGAGREERMLVDARRAEANKAWPRAVELYRSLWTFYPDDVEYGLLLAAALTRGGEPRRALEVVESLRALPSPAGSDARIDIEEASAAASLADYDRGRRAAAAARRKAERAGLPLVEAAALWFEAGALRATGSRAEALALLDRARAIYGKSGDRGGVAETLGQSGLIARELGDLDRAERLYRDALSVTREIGYRRATATVVNNIGVLEMYRGRMSDARRSLEEAQALYREIDDPVGVAGVLSPFAQLLAGAGDLEGARASAQALLDLAHTTGNRSYEASARRNLGMIAAERGAWEEALSHFEAAGARFTELRDRNKQAWAEALAAGALFRLGRTTDARAAGERALATARELGDRVTAARAIHQLVPIACELGDLARARALAEDEWELAEATGSAPLVAAAWHDRGVVALASGDATEAKAAFGRARRSRESMGLVGAARDSREGEERAEAARTVVSQR